MTVRTFKAIIRKERFFIAECPELGLEAQGRNVDEAVNGLKLATEEYFESLGGEAALTAYPLPEARQLASDHRTGIMTRRYQVDIS